MTHLTERLAQLRRHLDHLETLKPRLSSATDLKRDLSLHNDVLFSLLTVCLLVIDIAGELCSRRGVPFEDYTEAVHGLAVYGRFPSELIESLARLPGFRNVLIHEYVTLDYDRVLEALQQLEPIARFAETVRQLESELG